jgi:methylmalonyl-CoA mutase N-terminal domain/subunit
MQEAGATSDIDARLYPWQTAWKYLRTGVQAGLDIDTFLAPRLSFFLGM